MATQQAKPASHQQPLQDAGRQAKIGARRYGCMVSRLHMRLIRAAAQRKRNRHQQGKANQAKGNMGSAPAINLRALLKQRR